MKIFLIGFPGCGKSFIAKQAASGLKIPFFDTDLLIEEEMHESVQKIFESRGEEFFRQKEAEVIRTFSKKKKAMVSAGGGLPCFKGNMEWMNGNGITVYLEASGAFLFHRLVKEKKMRPLIARLTDVELMIYITENLAARRAFYEHAHWKINAENLTPAKLISFLKKKMK